MKIPTQVFFLYFRIWFPSRGKKWESSYMSNKNNFLKHEVLALLQSWSWVGRHLGHHVVVTRYLGDSWAGRPGLGSWVLPGLLGPEQMPALPGPRETGTEGSGQKMHFTFVYDVHHPQRFLPSSLPTSFPRLCLFCFKWQLVKICCNGEVNHEKGQPAWHGSWKRSHSWFYG